MCAGYSVDIGTSWQRWISDLEDEVEPFRTRIHGSQEELWWSDQQ